MDYSLFLPNELIQYIEFLQANDFFVMPFLGKDYEIIAKDANACDHEKNSRLEGCSHCVSQRKVSLKTLSQPNHTVLNYTHCHNMGISFLSSHQSLPRSYGIRHYEWKHCSCHIRRWHVVFSYEKHLPCVGF